MAVNEGPTHLQSSGSDGMLDLIIEPEKSRHLTSVKTILVGYSDHRLVKVSLHCARPIAPRVTYIYRDFRRMDVCAFISYIRQTISFTSASSDVDESVHQLEQDITRGLDRLLQFLSKPNDLVVSVTNGSQRKPMKPNKTDVDWRDATREHDRQRISWHIAVPGQEPVH